jgi:hemoglobin-like flavoprotein
MTPKQVALVQVSWEKVQPVAEQAAELFYSHLFSLDPSLKALFKGDMKAQGRKLMSMITFAVNGLTRLDAIVPGVQALGRRHAGYGVNDSHYETVGAALLWTLRQGLGRSFTGEVQAAWTAAYNVLASTMKDAARTPA